MIRPEAEADLAEQFEWYEDRKRGLGYEFLEEVRTVLQSIEEKPLRHAEVYRNARRAFVRRFPFKIYYVFDAGKVEVIAVVHVRRNPERWQKRVP